MRIENNTKTALIIISIVLLFGVFYWIDYLANNGYIVFKIKEGFVNIIRESSDTNYTVNMPINTTTSCKNFCGPTSRCAITGQQCFADLDCIGCQPRSSQKKSNTENVPAANDAGKMTTGVSLNYSPLTYTYQSFLRVPSSEKPAMANFGKDTWSNSFNKGTEIFRKGYSVNGLQFEPNYKNTYTTTGQFITDDPLPSNY